MIENNTLVEFRISPAGMPKYGHVTGFTFESGRSLYLVKADDGIYHIPPEDIRPILDGEAVMLRIKGVL